MVATAGNDRIYTSSGGSATGAAKALEAGPAVSAAESNDQSNNDMHLSELIRTLRALAGESPERQEHIERLARAYALGSYQVDAQAIAGEIIRDGLTKL